MAVDRITRDVTKAATAVYEQLGACHEEVIYREAMSIELQSMGYTVKTELPVEIRYETSQGKVVTVGFGKADLYIERRGIEAILELKTVGAFMRGRGEYKGKELIQLRKYIRTLSREKGRGFLVNFPVPSKNNPDPELEIIDSGTGKLVEMLVSPSTEDD